ncbi:unnamed protein product [Sphenostylis stenocarpa]|uniref:Uncharacterized protein n=1 Tax=Sphenostylis stenocarpa TaxID=92480 RepID=A0AA86VBP7_9FABA|nr:unnamed protein product [Sphenostylis stenocarpa]
MAGGYAILIHNQCSVVDVAALTGGDSDGVVSHSIALWSGVAAFIIWDWPSWRNWNPQLLRLSGIGPAKHLKAHGINVVLDQPWVLLENHGLTLSLLPFLKRFLSRNILPPLSLDMLFLSGIFFAAYLFWVATEPNTSIGGVRISFQQTVLRSRLLTLIACVWLDVAILGI